MLAIVVSRADSASKHIGEHVLELAEWTDAGDSTSRHEDGTDRQLGTCYRTEGAELRVADDLHLSLENVARWFDDPDLLAFASRHSGDTGPLLTAHTTGNFGPAEYGGHPGELPRAAPNALSQVLAAFDKHAPAGYQTGLECTHHGPSRVGCPSLFVELGSGEDEWADPGGARAVAKSILSLRGVNPENERTLVGFGGGHYVPRFERIVRETDWAVGHIAADWALDAMGNPEANRELLQQAFERCGATHAVIDGDRPSLTRVITDLGYRTVSETWVRETTSVPLSTVAAIEDTLGSVEDGVRFGGLAAGYGGDITRETIPTELTEAANNVDHQRVYEIVDEQVLAYTTEEGGTKICGEVILPATARRSEEASGTERREHRVDRDVLVDGLVDVLREKYDMVTRREAEVIAREHAFDPDRARELGIPEGPAFGKLASGQPVEVDGNTVEPADVQVERTERFPL